MENEDRHDHRAWIAISVVVALVVSANAVVLGPQPVGPGRETSGDVDLAGRVRDAIGPQPGMRAMAVAVVDDGSTEMAGIGLTEPGGEPVDPRTSRFEIGSITKALTGMLMAEMSPESASLDEEISAYLGQEAVADSGLGGVTLSELAHHRSGLPRLPWSPGIILGSIATRLGSHDPYPSRTADHLVAQAAETPMGTGGEFEYSNLGAAVAGQTLAAAAGQAYEELIRDRLLDPLGMEDTQVVASAVELPAERVTGSDEYGRPQSAWISEGYAPAGVGVWSTASDLGSLIRRVLDGSAPGVEATEPDVPTGSGDQIGLFWLTTNTNGRTITWHNGGTGGFRSWVGFDPAAGTGVALLAAGRGDLSQLGLHLLGAGEAPASAEGVSPGWFELAVLLYLVFIAWRSASSALKSRSSGSGDLVSAISLGTESLAALALGWVLGPWMELPWIIWSLLASITVVSIIGLGWFRRRSAWIEDGSPRRRVFGMALNTGLMVAVFALVL